MRILVTGASGFCGAHIARFLARAGHRVTGLYRRPDFRHSPLAAEPGIELRPGDLTGGVTFPEYFDVIVHAAATSPAPGITAATIVSDNVRGMLALIEAARASPCRAFIFFSSISLYGRISEATLDEHTPCRMPDVYGTTKLLGERLLANEADWLPSLSLRLPGIVGPGAHRNWLSEVAAKLIAGQPVSAFNLSGAYNNAAHIADIARLIDGVTARNWQGSDAIILGAGGKITVRDAIERLARQLGATAKIEEIPAPKPPFTLDSSRAMARWGYEPMDIGALVDRYGAEMRASAPQRLR